MELDPKDPFERVVGQTAEAERREKAVRPLYQYERGLLTVKELAEKLEEIVEAPAGLES